jgi:glycosyltransferase involved in cell wall biosynthesis
MDISVIVAAYNAESFIGDTLESVLSHDVREVIVVDDGSTDSTAARVRATADPRLRLIAKSHVGVSAARNSGAKEARGRYLFLIDADDVLLPRGLAMLLRAMRDDGVVCAYGNVGRIHRDGTPMPDKPLLSRPSGDVLRTLLTRNFVVSVGNALVRRDAFVAAGMFDEGLIVGEDWELWCRLALRGRFRHVNAKILHYRVHGGSAMAKGWEQRRLLSKTIAALSANEDIRRRLGPSVVESLLAEAEARGIANLAVREIVARNFFSAGRLMLQSAQRHPPGVPGLAVRALFALAGRQ